MADPKAVTGAIKKEPQVRISGRTFVSQGRGFSPFSSTSSGFNDGSAHSHGSGFSPLPSTSSGFNDGSAQSHGSGSGQSSSRDSNNAGGGIYFKRYNSRGIYRTFIREQPRPYSIPEDPNEYDDEIFDNEVSSNTYFNNSNAIDVSVSGENPEAAINSFEEAGLGSFLLNMIRKYNYSRPTPIQKYAFPIILNGRDLMACAQTGSGKTAAFLIPIVHRLLEDRADLYKLGTCKPRAIIVSPTRELACQTLKTARKFSSGSFLKVAIVYGGTSVFYQWQNIMMGCHILVATPGRLLFFLRRGVIELSEIKFIVLDEADRMLDMGFLPDIRTLLTHPTMVPSVERQTLMFSATFPDEMQRLAGKYLNNYIFIAVGIVGGACSDVEQRFLCITKFEKRKKLVELLTEMGSNRCLVFVERKRTTDFIAAFLCEKNFSATSIHGDREQKEREEALQLFTLGRIDILVATSVAARGLDIKNVVHVINFDLPKTVDEYVHRIGRTGRLGNRGLATSFYDPSVDKPIASGLVKIIRQAGQAVPDFLKGEEMRNDNGRRAKFGGRDVRNMNFMDISRPQEITYENEPW